MPEYVILQPYFFQLILQGYRAEYVMCFVVQMDCVQQLPLVVVTQRDFLKIHGVGVGAWVGVGIIFILKT